MISERVLVTNKTGLHARPASQFVKEAGKFKSKIRIMKDEKESDAKSIVSLLSLGINSGSEITITAEGEDESEAVENLVKLINKFAQEE